MQKKMLHKVFLFSVKTNRRRRRFFFRGSAGWLTDQTEFLDGREN